MGMGSRAPLLLVLLLLVSAPLSVFDEHAMNTPPDDASQSAQDPLTEEQRLAIAATHWNMMPQATMEPVDLAPSTGLLHLALGSFDPLSERGPEVPAGYARTNDVAHTGMAMLQLDTRNGAVLDRLVKQYDLTVLDVLHDEGWLVRLPADALSTFDALKEEEGVRWVGQHQPGWRVAPTLLTQPAAADAFAIIPTPDLGVGGFAALATDLVRFGAYEASCDAWMCYATAEASSASKVVQPRERAAATTTTHAPVVQQQGHALRCGLLH